MNTYWYLFLVVKIAYMFFATLIVSKFIVLGENEAWLSGTVNFFGVETFINSSRMMDTIGGVSSLFLGGILGNLPFVLASFYGLYYSINRLDLPNKKLILVLLLLSLPSFGIWSSIAGKEAVGVFSLGVILGYILDAIQAKRIKVKFVEFLAFYLLLVFKVQYYFAILPIILYVHLVNIFNLKGVGKLILFFIYIISTLTVLWIFKDFISSVSFEIPNHFSSDDTRTRENNIWIEQYDIFYNSIYGMWTGFIGPTFSEAFAFTHTISFFALVESLILVLLFVYVVFLILINTLLDRKLNAYVASLLFISVASFLFIHYPFGVLNPGSAIRYRTNFVGFLIVFVYFLHLRNMDSFKKKCK